MSIKKISFLYLIFLTVSMSAQNDSLKKSKKDNLQVFENFYMMEGDTIYLDEVNLLKKLHFQSNDDRNYYYWLRKKVHKAYPYAVIAQERMKVIDENLKNIKSKRQQKIYLKRLEEYFEKEFTDQLKKLTTTEGRILIKLVHRQTGKTVFELSKQYKNGWSAFWNQKTAKLFKQNLKDEYEPANDNEDFLTELILERAFEEHTLPPNPAVIPFDFDNIYKSKGKIIPVEWRIKKK